VIEHTDDEVHALVDVDGPHISSVPSDFKTQEIQTETQAERQRLEAEAHDKAEQAKKDAEQVKAHAKAQEAKKQAEDKAEEVKEKAQDVKEKAEAKAQHVKEKADEVKEQAKQKASKAADKAKANSDNPVVLGNTVAVVALGGLLGFGAYRKYSAGELTWKVASAWGGVVGLFALGDYYASQ
jgi:cation transport ATPase